FCQAAAPGENAGAAARALCSERRSSNEPSASFAPTAQLLTMLQLAPREAEALTRRPIARLRCEEDRQRRDLLCLLEPRASASDNAHCFLAPADELGFHRPRHKLIDADTMRSKLLRQNAHEHPQTGLGDAIGRARGGAPVSHARPYEDDLALPT